MEATISRELDAFLSERLNPAQKDAVTAPDGPLLILAGAGSGKTRVISYRIAFLVQERQVLADQILAVTFTNKAAGEMKHRVEQLIGPQARQVTLGTFHSICARWLRRWISRIGYDPSFSIYDDDDQLSLLKRLYVDAGINPKQHAPQAVRSAISRAKEKLLTPQQYSQVADSPFELAVAAIYRRYQESLQEQNAVDFDDLLVLTLRLFDEAPDVLDRLQRGFRHVLVDEYQDVNKAQYLLVKSLAGQHRNLTIVGDDSQAIYGWRGADVRYILEFEHDFPECHVVRLEQNYRSTKTILSAAQAVEAGLRARREKQLWTQNDEGLPITVCRAQDERDEAIFVVREIEKLHGEGFKYGEIALMYRMNSLSRSLEEALVRRRLPYQIVGGTRFYERREIKDVLAYLRLVNNPADAVSLDRIINVPQRGIGETTLEQLRDWASAMGVPMPYALRMLREQEQGGAQQARVAPPFGDRARHQLLAFAKLLGDLEEAGRTTGIVELFDTVILRTGYREYLANDKAGEERWENVMELRSVVSEYAGLEPGQGLRAFLENVSLVADIDSLKEEKDSITLLTMHAAKGLEYPAVFITGMEEGIFPHSRSQGDMDQMDEERRLCYVGMTRAMKRLYLIHCEMRTVFGIPRPSEPSQFLGVLPVERLRFVDSLGMNANPAGGGLSAVKQWSGSGTGIGSVQERMANRKQFGALVRPGNEIQPPVRRPGEAYQAPPRRQIPSAASVPPVRTASAPQQPVTPAKRKYGAGDRVRHTSFGEGTVLTSELSRRGEEEVRVRFDGAGVKTLLGALAPMEILAKA